MTIKALFTKERLSWAFFDFANSSYSLLIMTFAFPLFFKDVIMQGGDSAEFYWGILVSCSVVMGGLLAPIVGSVADYDKRRKGKFLGFLSIAILGCGSLYFTQYWPLWMVGVLFVVMHVCFAQALVLYDSFLIDVAPEKLRGMVSGFGWGLGYIGGIVAMLIVFGMLPNEGDYSKTPFIFPIVAGFFLVFSLPLLIFVREKKSERVKGSLVIGAKQAFTQIWETFKEFKKYKHIAWFFLGFYFLSDVLATIFVFTSIFMEETLLITPGKIVLYFIVVQVIGFPATVGFGWLSDRFGSKRMLLITLVIWMIAIVVLATGKSAFSFYMIAILVGLVIGSSQSIARSWLSKIIPEEKKSQFFGFNAFASKVSATFGPIIFGTISSLTGNQRIAMICLLPYFILSFIIFARIKE